MNTADKQETFKLREERIHKRDFLREHFEIDPYFLHFEGTGNTSSKELWQEFKTKRKSATTIKAEYSSLPAGELHENCEWVAGRIHSDRNGGMFLDIFDESGKMQLVTEKPDLESPETYEKNGKHFLELLDKGDIIAAYGQPYCTPRGELSIKTKKILILCKSLQPPPEIIENKRRRLGLTDVEVRYRQRYLDLMVNPDVKETFKKRAQIIAEIRHFLNEQNYLEFETPVLQTEAGGAAARPFVTHHNALNIDLYLRIATELHLKRLLVGGFEKIYEIGRIFRNEGISTRHNPEFTSVEIYCAYADYTDLVKLTEDLFKLLAVKFSEGAKFTYQDTELDFNPQGGWRKVKMADLVKEVTGIEIDLHKETVESAKSKASSIGVDVSSLNSVGEILNELFEQKCEETLIQPTFVTHYPRENSPLSFCSALSVEEGNTKPNYDPKVLERFELFVCGRELANGFTELNNPEIQRRVFEKQQKLRESGDLEAHPLDEDFIHALECGMPPTGGIGIGIDRLVMLLTNSASIRDVILFPTQKTIHK
jgi:lysyl-tRNA synthetase class 2